MPFVLDNSVAMTWCFKDERTSKTDVLLDRLEEDHALVPQLWPCEVANVLLGAQRRKRITEFDVHQLITLLEGLSIIVDPQPCQVLSLIELGQRHQLSAYDAAYLELAERHGIGLATVDEKLRVAAKLAGVPLLV